MSKLSEECEKIYALGGQYAVYKHILANHPKQAWAWCEPCEAKSPIDTDFACLVCASPTEPYWGQDSAREWWGDAND
jgi:hypothetical protein